MQRAPQLWLESLGSPDLGGDGLSAEEQRWGAALPAPRRRQYLASRVLLRQRVGRLLGCPPAELPLYAPPGQPPRLVDRPGWLGLSHSGGGLLMAWAPTPIGVDLECADRSLRARALIGRFFPEPECRQLQDWPESRLREAVLRSWVLKEAAIKWRCRTLAQELTHWSFDHHSGDLSNRVEGLRPPWRAGRSGCWRWAAVGADVERLAFQCTREETHRSGPAAVAEVVNAPKTNQSC